MVRCIVFDFFGTLVHYSPSRTEQGFHRSHGLLTTAGIELGYREFLDVWDSNFQAFEARAEVQLSEYSMDDVTTAFLAQCRWRGKHRDDTRLLERFVATYLEEWSRGVKDIPGIDPMLATLGRDYRLAVLSNTHSQALVGRLLERVGIAQHFTEVVTSIELGVRKPSAAAFEGTLKRLGALASESVFVGDNFAVDYEGAKRAGMNAFFVGCRDGRSHPQLPEEARLDSVLDLARRL